MTMLPTETLPDVLGPQPDLRSRGMFGGNGKNALLAALAGFMARRNPQMSVGIMNNLQEALLFKQRQAFAEQQYQRKRSDDRDDFTFEQDYKTAHPAPAQPTEYERLLQAGGHTPGTQSYTNHVNAYLKARENPPYFYTDPATGATMMIPRNAPTGGTAAPQGVTFTPIDEGGPGLGGPGGFPY